MTSTTAKAGKSKNQQLSSTNHCNDSSQTSWTNDNSPSLSLPSLSSKPTTTHPKSHAVSSSLSIAAAAAATAVAAAVDDTTNIPCNAPLKHCNGGVTSINNSNGSPQLGSPTLNARHTTSSEPENDGERSPQRASSHKGPSTTSTSFVYVSSSNKDVWKGQTPKRFSGGHTRYTTVNGVDCVDGIPIHGDESYYYSSNLAEDTMYMELTPKKNIKANDTAMSATSAAATGLSTIFAAAAATSTSFASEGAHGKSIICTFL